MAILEVEHISKNFEDTEVLKDIGFTLEKGEVLSIIGSSGSGKTTFLRCLNFLEQPDTGVIRVNGEVLFDAAVPQTKQEEEIRKKRLHFGIGAAFIHPISQQKDVAIQRRFSVLQIMQRFIAGSDGVKYCLRHLFGLA